MTIRCKTCFGPYIAGMQCPAPLAQFGDLSDGDGMCHPESQKLEVVPVIDYGWLKFPETGQICLHNRSDKHSITLVLVDLSRVVIPPKHGADVTQEGSKFVTAIIVTPEELRERYGDE